MVHAYSDCTVKSAFKTQYPDLLHTFNHQHPEADFGKNALYFNTWVYNCAANLD